ncbi:hypothetical protein V6N13_054420 [Hibiscus sabdariffa]|uniref:Uncharacterized protein n=1 Tax=Hibiscus sabdariffa TaxID=183260 RepID=A0ABR2DZI7_9ROSI
MPYTLTVPLPVMKASIFRVGSVSITSPALSGTPRVSLSRQRSLAGFSSLSSLIISLHFPIDKRKPRETRTQLRRALFDTDLNIIRLEPRHPGGSRCFTAAIPKEEYVSDCEVGTEFRMEFGFSGFGFGGQH